MTDDEKKYLDERATILEREAGFSRADAEDIVRRAMMLREDRVKLKAVERQDAG